MEKTALDLAYAMLAQIEQGGTYSYRQWDDAMASIELQLGLNTPRARQLATNIAAGQMQAIQADVRSLLKLKQAMAAKS